MPRLKKRSWDDTHKLIDGVDHKICGLCEEYLPSTLDYFYKNKANGIDGLHPYCKTCSIKKATKYQNGLSKEKREEYRKRHDLKPERLMKKREIKKRRMGEGYQIEWQRLNKEKIKQYNLNRSNKKHNITKEQWEYCKNYFNNECAYCGISLEEHESQYAQDLHKEHVDHNGSNDISNCVPSCKFCNSSKGEKELLEWYNSESMFCKNFSEDRLFKIQRWLEEVKEIN